MSRVSEQWSKASATSQGRTDANLANDSNNLGGIPAEDWATKKYVQDYHDGKEGNLKQYIDTQDASMLEQAKEYTNSQIRNQDFSGFAEIQDLQALNDNLTEQITEGLTEQKNYTDSKTQAIVDDVNANFQDVENSISTLNGTVNDLFTSVSNGKSLIAGAITDKGVTTSATDSYSTMATNIRSIKTAGDIEIDPNFVNTADGNATENDIRLGKIAYVKGQKVYGALVVEDGGGTEPGGDDDDNPNKGIDTSDATATTADIAYGKTAYARGQKLTGTLVNTQVEEIYGIDTEGATISNFLGPLDTDPETQEELGTGTIYYSKNLDYAVVNYPNKRYIYSHPIGNEGLYVMATTSMGGESTYKKYKYTYEELGISTDETIYDIAFGASGVDNDSHRCYLFITTKAESIGNIYLYIKTYHLRENGVIGQEYDGEEYLDYKYTLETNSGGIDEVKILPCNLDIKKFFYIYNTGAITHVTTGEVTASWQGEGQEYQGSVSIDEASEETISFMNVSAELNSLDITQDDKFILNFKYYHYNGNFIAININPDDDYSFTLNESDFIYSYDHEKKLIIESQSWIIRIYTSFKKNMKSIYLDLDLEDYRFDTIIKTYSIGDNIVCIYNLSNSNMSGPIKMAIFSGDISTLADGTHLTPEITYDVFDYANADYYDLNFYSDINTAKILVAYDDIYRQITFGVDTSNIIAVRYKDKIFYSIKEGILTATTSDVRSGKTFIGTSGTVSTGTMEVTE